MKPLVESNLEFLAWIFAVFALAGIVVGIVERVSAWLERRRFRGLPPPSRDARRPSESRPQDLR